MDRETLNPQVITTPSGEEMIVLPRADYEALVQAAAEAEEDAADAAVYAQRKAALRPEDVLPAVVSGYMTRGDSRLRAIRRWRGLGQVELAATVGIAQSYLSALETGDRNLTLELAERLVQALDVPSSWLEP